MLVSDFKIRIYFHALRIHLGGSNYCNNAWGLQYCKSEFIHRFCTNNVTSGSLRGALRYFSAQSFFVHKGNISMLKCNKFIIFNFRYLISSWSNYLKKGEEEKRGKKMKQNKQKTTQFKSYLSFIDMIFELSKQFQPNVTEGKGLKKSLNS